MSGVGNLTVTPVDTGGIEMDDVYADAFLDAAEHVRAEIRVVTPAWAREVLETRNDHNRKLSYSYRRLASVMSRGNWAINGEAVIFDRRGRLANGQHRLNAVVTYGKPVPMLIIYGVTDRAFETFDQVKKRSNSDILGLMGRENCTTLASALGWQRCYEMGVVDKEHHKTVPYDLLTETLEAYPGLAESVTYAVGVKTKLIPNGLLAFLHYQFTSLSPEQTVAFFHRVAKRLDIQEPSHEHLLVRRLDDMRGMRTQRDQITIAAIVIKTWNRIRIGEAVSQAKKAFVSWKGDQGEAFPDIL